MAKHRTSKGNILREKGKNDETKILVRYFLHKYKTINLGE